jgi:SNF2 family DNA or RNA helicase
VLTTYGVVASQKKQLDKYLEGKSMYDPRDPVLAMKFPLVHPKRSQFWRVILDEAQNIKAAKTRAASACHALQATHRWCLTGTPMMNGVQELYSLLRFLTIKSYSVLANFNHTFRPPLGQQAVGRHKAQGNHKDAGPAQVHYAAPD